MSDRTEREPLPPDREGWHFWHTRAGTPMGTRTNTLTDDEIHNGLVMTLMGDGPSLAEQLARQDRLERELKAEPALS